MAANVHAGLAPIPDELWRERIANAWNA
jgi:hypothetical protein